jgi:hypothetical protein
MTYKGSVTIDDMPLPLDWRHQLHDFLELRLPPEEILFSRHVARPIINPLGCDNAPDYFRSPYPELPPVEIGEYQCPTGMSRYGRALMVVDWPILKQIAKKCWGMTGTIAGDDVPLDWKVPTGSIDDQRVKLKFSTSENQEIEIKSLIPLPPYRIPGSKRDLWLLPLVDMRYYRLKNQSRTEIDADTWQEFFDAQDAFSTQDEIPEEYGKPDERLTNLGYPQPMSIVADIAALSVGMRIVYDPVDDIYKLVNAQTSKEVRIRRLAAPWIDNPDENSPTSPMLIAGGRTGAAAYVKWIKVHHTKNGLHDFWRIKDLPRSGIVVSSLSVWTTWEQDNSEDEGISPGDPTAEERANDFCQKVTDDIWEWMDSGGQYCFVGIHRKSEESNICGFDDYFSIQIKEHPKAPGEYVFTHRFYELPPMFLPDVLLVGGKKGVCAGSESKKALIVWPPIGGVPAATLGTDSISLGSSMCQPSKMDDNAVVTPDFSAPLVRVYNSTTSLVGAPGKPIQCKPGTIKRNNLDEDIFLADVEICQSPEPETIPQETFFDDDFDLGI